ncbi:hypothetical protein ACHAWU_008233 [Discostella pseudostelligera]|uniref:Protochlorophyllide reductase n=1 Tax=Discostella pseudostelligera TaxID=259834 RepID=A0ABD3M6X4_9STRA
MKVKSPHRPVAVVPSFRLLLAATLVVAYIPSSSLALLGFNTAHQQLHQQHHQQQPSASSSASASVHPPAPLRQWQRHLFSSKTNNHHCHDDDDHDDNDNDEYSSLFDMNRRVAFEQISGKALASLLLSSTILNAGPLLLPPAHAAATTATATDAPPDYDDTIKKRILITGCNSGIGFDAAQRMVVRGHEVVLACRTLDKAIAAADRIKTNIANNAEDAVDANALLKSLQLTPMECNLADLSSIDAFVKNLISSKRKDNNAATPSPLFDAVCYNAGVARNIDAGDIARTKDGFELTVGTNHLGHFYLNHLLLSSNLINNNNAGAGGNAGGRIVVTSSSVHDPESPGGAQGATATLGNLQGLENAIFNKSRQFDMVDGMPFNADKAYKDSKLCNILFVRELQRRLDQNMYASSGGSNNIKVNCFTPGLIVGTGLFRDQNQVFTKVFDIAATNLLKVGETTHYGGGALEYMTLSTKVGTKNGGLYYFSPPGSSKYGDDAYGKQFDESNVSKEAQESDNNGKAKRLWELSEKLVGISPM